METPENHNHYYHCLTARDRRFDGIFFVGVTSTGIYCRPICTARTPSAKHCRFFKSQAQAEQGGFRPCLKCRPELAPGNAPVDSSSRLAKNALDLIKELSLQAEESDLPLVADLADRLGISDRHLRRILKTEYGASPQALARTHRLLTAKKLLADSNFSLTEIAFASGFGSVRSFNHSFKHHYGLSPSDLKRDQSSAPKAQLKLRQCIRLTLAFRPPFDFEEQLAFLSRRSIKGVEEVCKGTYRRSVMVKGYRGWMQVSLDKEKESRLLLEFPEGLIPVLSTLVTKVSELFDLDAQPDLIASTLSTDPELARLIEERPGLRVAGGFDLFEICVRAVTGQLVSVETAIRILERLVQSSGDTIETPFETLTRTFPTPDKVATMTVAQLKECGLTATRANTIHEIASMMAGDRDGYAKAFIQEDQEDFLEALIKIKGVGPWTSSYIAMRAFKDPNAFPVDDLVIKKSMPDKSRKEILARANSWQPWRAYAAVHLWRSELTKEKVKS